MATIGPVMQACGGVRDVRILEGFQEIADSYDVILCDVWGVLHDGKIGHRLASEALIRFRQLVGGRPKRVILVSNAPRPWHGVRTILDGFGVPRDAYDAILTSGDLMHDLLAARPARRIHHLGPERDLPIFDGLDVERVDPDQAELVVCTGLFDDDTETADDYHDVLVGFAGRNLTMICANPDLVVERDKRLIPCAGLIAAAYEALGGEVIYAGKPYPPIYDAALRKVSEIDGSEIPDTSRVLAIGDALRTDIVGAADAGIPSLLVARGIHAKELGVSEPGDKLGDIATWLDRQETRPDAVIERLVW